MNERRHRPARLPILMRRFARGDRGGFLRAAGGLSLVRVAGGGLLFLSQILLASWMGAEAFGTYSLAWACVAITATLTGLGLPGTVVRFVATYRAGGEPGLLRGLMSFSRTWTLTAATAIAALCIVLVPQWPRAAPYADAVSLAFIAVPALAVLNLDSAIARGCGWITWSAIAEQIARPAVLIVIGAAVAASVENPSAEHFVVACAAAYAVVALVQHAVVRQRINPVVAVAAQRSDRSLWTAVSAGVLLLNGSQAVRMNTDPLLVSLFLSPLEVGVYTAAMRVATLVAFVMMVAGVAAQPTIAALHSRGSRDELDSFVRRVTRSTFTASLALGIALAVAGRPILALFGPEFTAGYHALLILIAGHAMAASVGPLTSVLVMTGQQRWAAAIHTVSLPVNAALSCLLIPRFGIVGAALATATSLTFTQVALHVVARRPRATSGNSTEPRDPVG